MTVSSAWKYATSEIVNSHNTNYIDRTVSFRSDGTAVEVFASTDLFFPDSEDAVYWLTDALEKASTFNGARLESEFNDEDNRVNMFIMGWRAPKDWEAELIPGLNFK